MGDRLRDDRPSEPGNGEWLEIPIRFSALHDEELVDYADAALARDFFAAFLPTAGGNPLSQSDSEHCRPN